MKVQATSVLTTTISGAISADELLAMIKGAGLTIPDEATWRIWASADHADADVDQYAPLRFSITYQSSPVTTPPASASDGSPT